MAGTNKMRPPGTTAVPISTANAQAQIDNPAYKDKNQNDYGPFDTLDFLRLQQQYGFFTQGIGSNGKSRFDTNMVTGSVFPLGRNVVVKGIGFHFMFAEIGPEAPVNYAAQIQAFYTVMENSYLEVVIQGRQFEFQAPGTYWLPEIALSLVDSAATTGVTYDRVGDYIKHGGYTLKQEIALQNLVPWELDWYVNLQNPAVAAALVTLTPTDLAPARLRWQFLGHLSQSV